MNDDESMDTLTVQINRFVSPDVWVESVMQQLSINLIYNILSYYSIVGVFHEDMDKCLLQIAYGKLHLVSNVQSSHNW